MEEQILQYTFESGHTFWYTQEFLNAFVNYWKDLVGIKEDIPTSEELTMRYFKSVFDNPIIKPTVEVNIKRTKHYLS